MPLLLILVLGGFFILVSTPSGPRPEARAALQSDAEVQVETELWLVFRPLADHPTVGLALYPGGHVDPRSYAPPARALAEQGTLVAIVPVPLNLAVFAPDRAAEVMAEYPEIDRWAVGGHSLGGAMAARFAYQNPNAVEGLARWAAYPASTDDLSSLPLAVTSISATRDGLASADKIAASRPLLLVGTRWVVIEGGNHTQFG
jgi:dienelactone hydrolase